MTSSSPPLSREMSPDITSSDSENDDDISALPHNSPRSRPRHDNYSASTRPATAENTHRTAYEASGYTFHETYMIDHQFQGDQPIDYEEQLKSLEAQNKRRRAMARQEQEQEHYAALKQTLVAADKESTAASQTPVLDNRPISTGAHHLSQQQTASITMNQAIVDQYRLPQARLQLQLQEHSSYRTAQVAKERQNQDAPPDFDADSYLKPNNSHDAWNVGGSSILAPADSTAAWEKERNANLEHINKQQQYSANQKAAQQAIFATQMANRGPNNIYRAPQALLYQQARAINPQNPYYVSAQTINSRTQGPQLYHAFQAIGPGTSSLPQPNEVEANELPLPSGVKRVSSADQPSNDRASKRSRSGMDLSDIIGEKRMGRPSIIHENSSPTCSPDPNMADSDNPSAPRLRSSETHAQLMSAATRPEVLPEVSRAEDRGNEIDSSEVENNVPSPAHSSTTLDDEEERAPLNENEMEVDQENATEMKSIDFDSGISVTTTTFKDGKTMTVMRVGGGCVKGKAKETRQGVEIVTKTVVIQGVVTTTTTTALIPMPVGSGEKDDELEWEQ